jgi:hypothetical protein
MAAGAAAGSGTCRSSRSMSGKPQLDTTNTTEADNLLLAKAVCCWLADATLAVTQR